MKKVRLYMMLSTANNENELGTLRVDKYLLEFNISDACVEPENARNGQQFVLKEDLTDHQKREIIDNIRSSMMTSVKSGGDADACYAHKVLSLFEDLEKKFFDKFKISTNFNYLIKKRAEKSTENLSYKTQFCGPPSRESEGSSDSSSVHFITSQLKFYIVQDDKTTKLDVSSLFGKDAKGEWKCAPRNEKIWSYIFRSDGSMTLAEYIKCISKDVLCNWCSMSKDDFMAQIFPALNQSMFGALPANVAKITLKMDTDEVDTQTDSPKESIEGENRGARPKKRMQNNNGSLPVAKITSGMKDVSLEDPTSAGNGSKKTAVKDDGESQPKTPKITLKMDIKVDTQTDSPKESIEGENRGARPKTVPLTARKSSEVDHSSLTMVVDSPENKTEEEEDNDKLLEEVDNIITTNPNIVEGGDTDKRPINGDALLAEDEVLLSARKTYVSINSPNDNKISEKEQEIEKLTREIKKLEKDKNREKGNGKKHLTRRQKKNIG